MCLSTTGSAELYIAGKLLVSSLPGPFDATVDCVDTELPIGLVPLHLGFASGLTAEVRLCSVSVRMY